MLFLMPRQRFQSTESFATILALKQLSTIHSVRLLCVPGHYGVEGNETIDVLAKQAAFLDFVGLEPAISLVVTYHMYTLLHGTGTQMENNSLMPSR